MERRDFLRLGFGTLLTGSGIWGCGHSRDNSTVIIADNVASPTPELLPYGSSDSSVVFRRSLKQQPTDAPSAADDIGNCSVTVNSSGTVIFDPILGFTNTAGYLLIQNPTSYATLGNGGQISLDIEASLIAQLNSSVTGSIGTKGAPAANESILWVGRDYAGSNFNLYMSSSSGDRVCNFATNASSSFANGVVLFDDADMWSNTPAEPGNRFIRLNICWRGNVFEYYVGGVRVGSGSAINAVYPDLLRMIYFGIDAAPGIWPMVDGHVRNFQIANRPPDWTTPSLLGYLTIFGDSFSASGGGNYQNSSFWNANKILQMDAVFRDYGYQRGNLGNMTSVGAGGLTITNQGGTRIPATYVSLKEQRLLSPTVLPNATCVVMQAGANDVGFFDPSLSLATRNANYDLLVSSLKEHVESIFGLDGSAAGRVDYSSYNSKCLGLVINTTPKSINNTSWDMEGTLHAAIKSIPGWFGSAYPNLAGRIVVHDMYRAYGGENYMPALWGDNIHPGPYGWYVMGREWGKGVMKLL